MSPPRARFNLRRVAAVAAAGVAAAVLMLRLTAPPAGPAQPAPAAASVATAQVSTGATPSNTPGAQPTPAHPVPSSPDPAGTGAPAPRADPAAAAAGFAQDWTRHTGDAARTWAGRLARWCTPQLIARLRGTDPAAVPASTVTGPADTSPAGAGGWAESRVPTDAGDLHLRLRHTDRWRVDAVDWTPTR